VDDVIGVTVVANEVDDGNDFVESNKASITGMVADDTGAPLEKVILILTKPDGTTVTTLTDSNGEYSFSGLPPGDYTVEETNPNGYPGDLSDYDQSPDGDTGDSNTTTDNKIVVTLTPGEKDTANNFVDIKAIPATPPPTSSPVTPAPTASPVTPAPTLSNTASITGTVKDDDGKAIPNILLELVEPTEEFEADSDSRERVLWLSAVIPMSVLVILSIAANFVFISHYGSLVKGTFRPVSTRSTLHAL